MKLYAIYTADRPTFFLDPDVQGITSPNHAERIAREIVPNDVDVLAVMVNLREGN